MEEAASQEFVAEHDAGGVEVVLQEVRRTSGDSLTVRWRYRNRSGDDKLLAQGSGSWSDPYLRKLVRSLSVEPECLPFGSCEQEEIPGRDRCRRRSGREPLPGYVRGADPTRRRGGNRVGEVSGAAGRRRAGFRLPAGSSAHRGCADRALRGSPSRLSRAHPLNRCPLRTRDWVVGVVVARCRIAVERASWLSLGLR